MLSPDGGLAAIDASHGLGLSSYSTYEVVFLDPTETIRERITVIDRALATAMMADGTRAEGRPPMAIRAATTSVSVGILPHPGRSCIRLFGSRARGESTTASDWDLFVVVSDDLEAADDLFAGYRLRRETRTRADIVLCPLGEFKEDRDTPNTLAYEAAHHGIVIYERCATRRELPADRSRGS